MDDAQLLDHFVKKGDQGAFAALVQRHAGWVLAAACRQLGDRQLAEDAVQVVFILLAQKAAVMNRQKLSGWLFNTLRYTVRNIRRAGKRRSVHEQAAALRDHDDPPPSPERVKELAEVMDDAVARLPRKYREAVLLRFYEGMGFEQVAGALAITEAAARKRVERAIEMLRGNVGPEVGASLMSASALVGAELFSNTPAAGGMGAGFIQATVQTALAAKTAGTAPATLAATVKGVGAIMTMGKVQAAALATVAIMGVGVPMTLVGVELATQARASEAQAGGGGAATGPAATPAADEKALADFNHEYGLDDDEVLRWIPPPLPASREAGFRYVMSQPTPMGITGNLKVLAGADKVNPPMTGQVFIKPQAGGGAAQPATLNVGGGVITVNPAGGGRATFNPAPIPSTLVLNWNDDKTLTIRDARWSGAPSMPIKWLLSVMTGIPDGRIDLPKELGNWTIRGDWVMRNGAPMDKVLPLLAKFLSQDKNMPLTLSIKEVERQTYVLSGHWNFTPASGLPPLPGRGPQVTGNAVDTVTIYGGDAAGPAWRTQGTGVGNSTSLIDRLSRWIGEDVIIEAQGVPDNIGWRTLGSISDAPENPVAHDPKMVLDHVAAQTGLKLTQELRKQKRVVMETQMP